MKTVGIGATKKSTLPVSLALTNKQTKLSKSLCKDRNHFRFSPSNSTFDFLPSKSRYSDPPSFFYHLASLCKGSCRGFAETEGLLN